MCSYTLLILFKFQVVIYIELKEILPLITDMQLSVIGLPGSFHDAF